MLVYCSKDFDRKKVSAKMRLQRAVVRWKTVSVYRRIPSASCVPKLILMRRLRREVPVIERE